MSPSPESEPRPDAPTPPCPKCDSPRTVLVGPSLHERTVYFCLTCAHEFTVPRLRESSET